MGDFTVFYWIADHDGCAAARCLMPSKYAETMGQFKSSGHQMPISSMFESDIVTVQRRHSDKDMNILLKLREKGKKIVVDMDDDLFHLPPSNPASRIYTKENLDRVTRLLRFADLVTVSTDTLAGEVRKYNDRVEVVPNAVPVEPLSWCRCRTQASGNIRIGWMGSITHDEDLRAVCQAMMAVAREREDVEIAFMGGFPGAVIADLMADGLVTRNEETGKLDVPAETIARERRIFLIRGVPVYQFYDNLVSAGFHIGLAPLADNAFNRSKSNIKYLEYTAIAGVPTIASDVLPYGSTIEDGVDGVLVRKMRVADWKRAILRLVDDEKLRISLWQNAYRKVATEYNISLTVRRWKEVYAELLEG
ncbi:MAG: glycosyltransferase [Deltaproteobacteria bacterium]|nr:glycosyltransferase [Candidatus Zymogenaceae bacterium]